MDEIKILCEMGAVNITAYSAIMASGLLLGTLLSYLCARKTMPVSTLLFGAVWATLGAVVGGHLLYCLAMLPSILADFQSGLSLLYRLNMGGYALCGGVAGGMAAVWLYARFSKQKAAPLLDALVPGALLVLTLGRAAEFFTTQGRGDYLDDLENALLCRFPFAVATVYEDYVEWRYAIFAWEAAAAALVLLFVLATLRRVRPAGRRTETALVLVCASQILLEQLRQDGFLRFGFIRITQLAAIAAIVAVLSLRIIRCVKESGWTLWQFGRMAMIGLGAAVVILVEFAYDKPQVLFALRLCIGALCALCALCLMRLALNIRRRGAVRVSLAALGVADVACGAVLIVLLTRNLPWESAVLTASMALALVAVTAATLCGDSDASHTNLGNCPQRSFAP